MSTGTQPAPYLQTGNPLWTSVEAEVIEESPLTLFVNGQEWVTLMCTPVQLEDLALGFLAAEGVIERAEEVELLDITHRGTVADVWLRHPVTLPRKRVLTSGCAGGVTFGDLAATRPPLSVECPVTPAQILTLMEALQEAAQLYRRCQGVHTSALSDGVRLLAVAEDVGRHNTLDKIRGACLRGGIATRGGILLTTGRVSSEMLHKAAAMETPVVVSRTSPTSLSVNLARAWNITLIGYVRGRRMRIYTGAARFGASAPPVPPTKANGHKRR